MLRVTGPLTVCKMYPYSNTGALMGGEIITFDEFALEGAEEPVDEDNPDEYAIG